MIYAFEDGRILYDLHLLIPEDYGKYVEIESLPIIKKIVGKVGVITGCNLKTSELIIEYFDIPESIPIAEPVISAPELTETERIMQAMTDAELRDLATQQNQELLAQQMADIEVALLGGER